MDIKNEIYLGALSLGYGWHTTLDILRVRGLPRTPKYLALLDELVTDGMLDKRVVKYRADGQERAEFCLSQLTLPASASNAYSVLLAYFPLILRHTIETSLPNSDLHTLAYHLVDQYKALEFVRVKFSDGSSYVPEKS